VETRNDEEKLCEENMKRKPGQRLKMLYSVETLATNGWFEICPRGG
jgi:hypothetical protein